MADLRSKLTVSTVRLDEINAVLADENNPVVNELLAVVEKYGGPEAINEKAEQARNLKGLMARMADQNSPYLKDVEWLIEQRDNGAFCSMAEYYERVTGNASPAINQDMAVTLEVSALQYFPWLITEAKQAIEKRELMPGRFIRVRAMKEQVADNGDILAVAAAMQVLGASYVETLDTKGTDGSNVHLGGPATITGYFGGIGQPNRHVIEWIDEYLHYYTTYGIKQVLNINAGSILAAYLLHKLGVDNEFKISVFMGNDNPFAVLWTLMAARMFAREDGTTSLIGFNFGNSVDNETIRQASWYRKQLGLENVVRFEHHIVETWKSIVVQPYDRRAELIELAKEVPNISAKHEGGDPEVEQTLDHPSDILDYFMPKADVIANGLWDAMENNYLEKHNAVNHTADDLTKAGIGVVCAGNVHK
jgi:hypothetical protein